MTDLSRLKEAALKCMGIHPGPWKLREYANNFGFGTALDDANGNVVGNMSAFLRPTDREYIALANPSTILDLIAKIEEKWVDVKQELPPANEYVYWAMTNGKTAEGYYEPWANGMQFWRMTRYPGDPRSLHEVTHWRRPALPEKEEV